MNCLMWKAAGDVASMVEAQVRRGVRQAIAEADDLHRVLDPTLGEYYVLDARNAGSRSSLRSPDPLLEPEDDSLHLRPTKQDSHRQPRAERCQVSGSTEVSASAGCPWWQGPVRRHQARSSRARRPGSRALRHALCRQPSAGWHDDQLQRSAERRVGAAATSRIAT